MPRHLVCLTFDFDVVSGFMARGMTTPTPMSRGEFGLVGARRILALLKKYDIKATWFVPGHTLESFPDNCRELHEAGHEIAHHGWTHVPPANLTREQEEAEMVRANAAIKKLTGKYARGYRSCSWDLSANTVELLLKHGFLYDTSMMGHDTTPYFARIGDRIDLHQPFVFGKPTSLIELPISWTLDDYPHFEFVRTPTSILPGLSPASGVLENWVNDFTYMTRTEDWGVITYTCHPFVIGRGHRMMMLEELIKTVRAGGAEFATMEAVAAEWRGRSGS